MDAKDRAAKQLDQIEKQYRQVVDALQEQFGALEERFEDFLDDMQEQLPDTAKDMLQQTREFGTENRDRVAAWSAQLREATSEAVDAAVTAVQGLAGRDEAAAELNADNTKAELYAEAVRLDIAGRSSMSKAQLLKAIKAAR